jgi:holo-[acyl-carrier protein] synthase
VTGPSAPHPLSVGIDQVEIARFREVLARTPSVARRVFTPGELAAVEGRADPVPGLAARFAAKEAVMKALGAGLGALGLTEIEVTGRAGEQPGLLLRGRAATRARDRGVSIWAVSLTHTRSTAAAVAVAS